MEFALGLSVLLGNLLFVLVAGVLLGFMFFGYYRDLVAPESAYFPVGSFCVVALVAPQVTAGVFAGLLPLLDAFAELVGLNLVGGIGVSRIADWHGGGEQGGFVYMMLCASPWWVLILYAVIQQFKGYAGDKGEEYWFWYPFAIVITMPILMGLVGFLGSTLGTAEFEYVSPKTMSDLSFMHLAAPVTILASIFVVFQWALLVGFMYFVFGMGYPVYTGFSVRAYVFPNGYYLLFGALMLFLGYYVFVYFMWGELAARLL